MERLFQNDNPYLNIGLHPDPNPNPSRRERNIRFTSWSRDQKPFFDHKFSGKPFYPTSCGVIWNQRAKIRKREAQRNSQDLLKNILKNLGERFSESEINYWNSLLVTIQNTTSA